MRHFLYVMALCLLSFNATSQETLKLSWEDLIPAEERKQQSKLNLYNVSHTSINQPEQTQVGSVRKDLHNKRITLTGFLIPLEVDEKGKLQEFLLVPFVGACIHVPPPPPNQIIYVTMKSKAIPMQPLWQAVEVTGKLHAHMIDHGLAKTGYTMDGESYLVVDE